MSVIMWTGAALGAVALMSAVAVVTAVRLLGEMDEADLWGDV